MEEIERERGRKRERKRGRKEREREREKEREREREKERERERERETRLHTTHIKGSVISLISVSPFPKNLLKNITLILLYDTQIGKVLLHI